jgi:hypothetical protein
VFGVALSDWAKEDLSEYIIFGIISRAFFAGGLALSLWELRIGVSNTDGCGSGWSWVY